MNPAATQPTTASRPAYGVFSQFWLFLNTDNPQTQRSALDLLNPGIDFKVTGFGLLQANQALGYAKHWLHTFGPLGNPHHSNQVCLHESDDKETATIVLESFFREEGGRIKAVPYSERKESDQLLLTVHRVQLEEDGRIIRWIIMIDDERLFHRIR